MKKAEIKVIQGLNIKEFNVENEQQAISIINALMIAHNNGLNENS